MEKVEDTFDRIWEMLHALPLDNRKWLRYKLQMSIEEEENRPCRYSVEELEERLDASLRSYAEGRCCSTAELRQRHG